jgi:hypothetical protein
MKLFILFFFVACTVNEKQETNISINGQNYCNNSAECAEGQLCVDNHCLDSECFSSSDCQLEEYCSEFFQCVPGCSLDSDCLAGDACIENTCTSQGCRTTDLDCEVGEYCDSDTQSCYEDSFDHCGSCDYSQWTNGVSGGECVVYSYDEFSYCNWDGWTQTGTGCRSAETCLPMYLIDPLASNGGFCASIYKFKVCTPGAEDACPRGFNCVEDIYGDGTNMNVCISDCDYLIANGYY